MGKKLFSRDCDVFFRKDKAGRDIFYPWGYPGEGVFLDAKQKHKVAFFVNFYCYFGALWLVSGMVAQELDIITDVIGNNFYLISFMCAIPIYVFSVRLIVRGKKRIIIPKEERPLKSKSLWVYLMILYLVMGASFYVDQIPVVLLMLYGLGFVFTAYVFVKIMLTRGYYFTG